VRRDGRVEKGRRKGAGYHGLESSRKWEKDPLASGGQLAPMLRTVDMKDIIFEGGFGMEWRPRVEHVDMYITPPSVVFTHERLDFFTCLPFNSILFISDTQAHSAHCSADDSASRTPSHRCPLFLSHFGPLGCLLFLQEPPNFPHHPSPPTGCFRRSALPCGGCPSPSAREGAGRGAPATPHPAAVSSSGTADSSCCGWIWAQKTSNSGAAPSAARPALGRRTRHSTGRSYGFGGDGHDRSAEGFVLDLGMVDRGEC